MTKYPYVNDTGEVVFSSYDHHQNPWSFSAEAVAIDVDMAGQGSHTDYDVAVLRIRQFSGGESIRAIIGREQDVDNLIKALQYAKDSLRVLALEQTVESTEREIARLKNSLDERVIKGFE